MRRYLIIILLFLPMLCGVKAGHGTRAVQEQEDTALMDIPQPIEQLAKATTDRQIDSVYSRIPPYIDAIRNDFRALRSRMDTINAEAILRAQEAEQAAIERDMAIQEKLVVIDQNTRLRAVNKAQGEKIDFAKSAPTYFMVFIAAIAGTWFASGVREYYNKRKKNA